MDKIEVMKITKTITNGLESVIQDVMDKLSDEDLEQETDNTVVETICLICKKYICELDSTRIHNVMIIENDSKEKVKKKFNSRESNNINKNDLDILSIMVLDGVMKCMKSSKDLLSTEGFLEQTNSGEVVDMFCTNVETYMNSFRNGFFKRIDKKNRDKERQRFKIAVMQGRG
jgi:hypothetical protein